MGKGVTGSSTTYLQPWALGSGDVRRGSHPLQPDLEGLVMLTRARLLRPVFIRTACISSPVGEGTRKSRVFLSVLDYGLYCNIMGSDFRFQSCCTSQISAI